MARYISMLLGVMVIYETRAAPNKQRHAVINDNLEDLSLFQYPYDDLSPSRNTDSESGFTERDKRFFDSIFPPFDFFTRRQSSFSTSSYGGYVNKDYNQNKGGERLDDIFRNPQDLLLNILSNRRLATVYLPVLVQPVDCGCSGTTQPAKENNNPITPFSDDVTPVKNSTITLPNRFNDYDEDDDGRRPVSFNPKQPKRPLSQQPPPFEHGSVQAGLESSAANSPPDLPSSIPESITVPSICDGAVVACCLQLNIGNCFERQGCEDASSYGDPCDPAVVSRVLEKFQRYYKQKGIQKNFFS